MTAKHFVLALLVCLALAIAAAFIFDTSQQNTRLAAILGSIVKVTSEPEVSCSELVKSDPLVLLALGQSNAGNHGAKGNGPIAPITLIAEGKCIKAVDPLPGGTGLGGSIWSRLPQFLAKAGMTRPVVIAVLGVDATSIEDWTTTDSVLNQRLTSQVKDMNRIGLKPDLVLWQQGEADARAGTTKNDYGANLDQLAGTLQKAGSAAPILLAQSTKCRSAVAQPIRDAIEEKIVSNGIFRRGPDTDSLGAEHLRFDGCHFMVSGLEAAARMWFTTILANAGSGFNN